MNNTFLLNQKEVKVIRLNTLFAAIVIFTTFMTGSAAAIPITAVQQIEGEITYKNASNMRDGSSLNSELPFSVGDNFVLTVSYTYDPAIYPPIPDTHLPANMINFSYQFLVGGLTVFNGSTGAINLLRSDLLTTNFGFDDEVPHFGVSPGSWCPVDEFYVTSSILELNLLGGLGDGGLGTGIVEGVINSSTMTTQPVPEPSTLLLLGAGFGGLAIWRRRRINYKTVGKV
jgi:hypothetical protein